jgi:hypothetical protein
MIISFKQYNTRGNFSVQYFGFGLGPSGFGRADTSPSASREIGRSGSEEMLHQSLTLCWYGGSNRGSSKRRAASFRNLVFPAGGSMGVLADGSGEGIDVAAGGCDGTARAGMAGVLSGLMHGALPKDWQFPGQPLGIPAQLREHRVEPAAAVLLQVERQVKRRDQLCLHCPRRLAYEPCHHGVLLQPLVELLLSRSKRQAVSVPHPPQLNAQLFRQCAARREPER